ncbi:MULTISPECIES: septal ring lytic transglycosylase RlpA family protein [Microvirga]|uniref:septal ring lytic transglycosylase RlpA family protein n=1 Tax=Microvirga TaxID=186650 RepID=UPI00299DFC45|nr:septal ring lytic transglycosylase RlpA family protein [Microvirga lenta]
MHWNRTGSTELMARAASFNHLALLRIAGVTAIALTVANCSSNVRGGIDPKYGVAPSPKVVADGKPVPKGGGRRMVGKPYTVAGRTYMPKENPEYEREGLASWYGPNFHGRMTANGEIFDRDSIAAAHTTMPLPSYARVTNMQNGHSMIVRVNDRGPFHGNRIIDVSERAAMALGFKRQGTARVKVEYVGRASTNGSDDRILLASLRTDGMPATLTNTAPTMIAEATPRPNAPRQTIPLRSYEPADGADETPRAPSAAPQTLASAGAARAPMAGSVPLPPERPFDLGTIPSAATPVPVASLGSQALPPSRPVLAGLYYTAPAASKPGFQKSNGFSTLDQSRFVR